MTEQIPLTVIIPVFNRQEKLDRALRSILAQKKLAQEILIVDDSSQPEARIPAGLADRANIRLLRREANGGAAAARNTGMAAASTDWIAFLDSDDIWLPDTLDRRWALVERDQDRRADRRILYGCSWIDCTDDGTELRVRHPRAGSTPLDFAGGCWFSPGTCIIFDGRQALEAAGPQDVSLRRLEDFDWFLSLALQGFRFEPQPIVGARIEIRRSQDPALIAETAVSLKWKWRQKAADGKILRRINGYLDLEIAGASHYRGLRLRMFAALARSFCSYPRLSLHASPGWALDKPG